MRVDGIISGTGGLTKISNDTLILGGANTFTGLTNINAGVVEVKNKDAFGGTTATTGITTLASGATIQIEGANFIIPEPITISGTGVSVNALSQGAIKNIRNKLIFRNNI
jgi:autotransporter-associated beta strand protein